MKPADTLCQYCTWHKVEEKNITKTILICSISHRMYTGYNNNKNSQSLNICMSVCCVCASVCYKESVSEWVSELKQKRWKKEKKIALNEIGKYESGEQMRIYSILCTKVYYTSRKKIKCETSKMNEREKDYYAFSHFRSTYKVSDFFF